MPISLSSQGIAIIKRWEQLRLQAYKPRPNPEEPWTIGWGHTRGVRQGMTITPEAAEEFLREDLEPIVANLKTLPHLTQSAFDALASLCFNCGVGAVGGRSTIGRALRAGDWRGAWRGFSLWTATPGAELGQARRRSEEMALFLSDDPRDAR